MATRSPPSHYRGEPVGPRGLLWPTLRIQALLPGCRKAGAGVLAADSGSGLNERGVPAPPVGDDVQQRGVNSECLGGYAKNTAWS